MKRRLKLFIFIVGLLFLLTAESKKSDLYKVSNFSTLSMCIFGVYYYYYYWNLEFFWVLFVRIHLHSGKNEFGIRIS